MTALTMDTSAFWNASMKVPMMLKDTLPSVLWYAFSSRLNEEIVSSTESMWPGNSLARHMAIGLGETIDATYFMALTGNYPVGAAGGPGVKIN